MRILVTGGSGGIGRSIVSIFQKYGHDVFNPTKDELNLLDTNIILDQINFDIIINNAGVNPLTDILNIKDEMEIVMRINYFSPFKIIQQCLPHMIKNQYGRIVNIGSIWTKIAKSNRGAYSASKHALDSLAKSLTAEYAKYNILSNTISPGFIETNLTYKNNTKKELNKIINDIPVKRLGRPEEIAYLTYQLTVHNTFITGQNIFIDGGFTCTAH